MTPLPLDILRIIAEYATDDIYELNPDISESKLDWRTLSANPRAIHLLKANPDKINLSMLCKNPSLEVIDLIEVNINMINWEWLLQNPNLTHLLKYKLQDIDWIDILRHEESDAINEFIGTYLQEDDNDAFWYWLCQNRNSSAIKIVEANIYTNKISWYQLSRNPSAIKLIEIGIKINKVDWNGLSSNPASEAIKLLKLHPDKINWHQLQWNDNPEVIPLLETCDINIIDWMAISERFNPQFINFIERHINIALDELNWSWISRNPHALHLLNTHRDKINWITICKNSNPNIIPLLEYGLETNQINWLLAFTNPNIFPFLKLHLDKVNWYELSKLPDIFIIKKDLVNIIHILDLLHPKISTL